MARRNRPPALGRCRYGKGTADAHFLNNNSPGFIWSPTQLHHLRIECPECGVYLVNPSNAIDAKKQHLRQTGECKLVGKPLADVHQMTLIGVGSGSDTAAT